MQRITHGEPISLISVVWPVPRRAPINPHQAPRPCCATQNISSYLTQRGKSCSRSQCESCYTILGSSVSSASREPSASPEIFAEAFTFFSGLLNLLISAATRRGEPARASAPIKAPRGCSRASRRFRYAVSRPDFCAAGIKSCSRSSLLPIRRGAKSACAEMRPISKVCRYFRANSGRAKCQGSGLLFGIVGQGWHAIYQLAL
jgi:hypothetical protein